MFYAVRLGTTYSNKWAVARYSNIQACGKSPTCSAYFGHLQGDNQQKKIKNV
jgi:hypothetical protein